MSDEDELNRAIETIENGATEIDLGENNIGDKGATALANALANNGSLQSLDLYSNKIGDEGATSLANALASNESLQTLYLGGNNVGTKGATALANALTSNNSLHKLDLGGNNIGAEGATALANTLANNELLHTLDLNSNNIGAEGASALANALQSNESLQTLNLYSNKIGAEGASALANTLANKESLQTLDLGGNNIGADGAMALANALADNESLQTLFLYNNNIGAEGATALANTLADNESLHTLDLNSNNIGAEGATALANALESNESLQTLKLAGNNIGNKGATELANALEKHESLQTLGLYNNNIGAEGVTALANALADNESLQTLTIRTNNIGDEGATALAKALAGNRTLQTLTINHNNPALEAALKRNRALYKKSLTPLMQACKKGDVTRAKALVADGAHIDARDSLGLTPMVHACNASDERTSLILAKLLFKMSVGLSSESLGLNKALALASSGDRTELSVFLSFVHSLPLAIADTKTARNVALKLFRSGVHTARTARGLFFSRLSTLGMSDIDQRIAFVKMFAVEPGMSALEALAAQASLARKMRTEMRTETRSAGTFEQFLSLQDEIAKAIGPKSPVAVLAKFDAQQENAKKKVEDFETLQEQVRVAPERALERDQAREEAVRLIEEALADGTESELEKFRKELDPEKVLDSFRELYCGLVAGEPTITLPPDIVITSERVYESTHKAHDALKAWMERYKTRRAYQRTVAAMDRLNEKAACATILMYPKKRRELAPHIRAIEDALTEEVNVLCAADADADADADTDAAQNSVLEALQLAWTTMTAFYERFLAFSIMRLKSAAMVLGQLLSRLKPGLSSPSTEEVQRLFNIIQSRTRKRKRLALDLEEAREDARRGTEEAKARVVGLEEKLTQIESVYKLDSELRRARARVLRHAEEHYPELLSDRTWLERIDVTDPATQKLSELGLLLSNAKRKDFQELADLAPSSGKSVLQVRDSDGHVFVLKSFHLAREEWSSRFYRQVTALAQLQSAYIVRIQGVFMQDAREGYILMPFYEGGDLATWIVDNPHADLATRRRIAVGLLSGLHDLHSRGLVHCDIKPGNVFLAKGLSPVLGDFDGVQKHDVTMTQPLQTTIKYMAPELRNRNVDKVQPAVDMFSVGVVLAELFEDAEMSDATQSLISDLQSADPNQRPTALEALRHEAFQVEPVKVASCTICLDIWPVSEGVSCADGHFTCKECLSESVRAAAQPQAHVNVRRDGSMHCITPDCNLLLSGATISAALPDEEFVALLKILREHFERDAAVEQERQVQQRVQAALQDYGEEFEVRNHLRIIQAEVLTLSCPRCKQAFADFEGCCALECAACPCHFCAWCFEDTGNDSDACHRHVASCTSKPRTETDAFFSSMDVVQSAWVKLRADRLQYYLRHKIANEATRDAVYEKLTPLLTPDIVGSHFIP